MNSLYIASTAVLLLQCISLVISCSNSKCSCQCKKDPPLKLIYQITTHFKEVQGCGRRFTSSQSVSSDGVRRINYQAELGKNESATQLCDCIHGYLGQKDWLDGSIQTCCVRKNIVTMSLEGAPDPKFDNSSAGNPLEQLERIFAQFRYGEFENHRCRPRTSEDKKGNIRFYVDCELRSDSPSKEDMCKSIVGYLNQGNWLGEMTYTCKVDGKLLNVEMMSKGNGRH